MDEIKLIWSGKENNNKNERTNRVQLELDGPSDWSILAKQELSVVGQRKKKKKVIEEEYRTKALLNGIKRKCKNVYVMCVNMIHIWWFDLTFVVN